MTKLAAPCAICGAAASADYRPFCSRRCADIDLGRWLTGRYAIPVEEEDPIADADGNGDWTPSYDDDAPAADRRGPPRDGDGS